jgi:hypothetical protein
MIEKTSENMVCAVCGNPAIIVIAGIPCCADCMNSKQVLEAQEIENEILESFKD